MRTAGAKKASTKGAQGNTNNHTEARENTHLKVMKHIGRPTETPTGKGLGKAGAKRLGRLLKRAIQNQDQDQDQDQDESAVTLKGNESLPKTPVRLFKHQIETEAEKALKTNTAKPASPHVSHLLLSVVSQCKHRGGISMADLKQTLAAEGYDFTKNSRRVNVVTNRLVNDETLVRTTRNVSFRLNNKTDTKQIRTSSVKSPKPKGDLKQSKTASTSPEGAGKSQRQARKTPKTKGQSHKSKGKTAAKSNKPGKKTPKARRKSPKPAGKKCRSATN